MCWRGAPPPSGGPPSHPVVAPEAPPTRSPRDVLCGQDCRGGERAALDVALETGAPPSALGTPCWFPRGRPAQPSLCVGTCFHSQPPGSGRRHCGVTPNAEKGTAHPPCYGDNTLADNDWTALKRLCSHTPENALGHGLHGRVETAAARPGLPLSMWHRGGTRSPDGLRSARRQTPHGGGPAVRKWPGHPQPARAHQRCSSRCQPLPTFTEAADGLLTGIVLGTMRVMHH